WVQADPNRPLTTGDNLWADRDSRGEVHIGSTAIRLSSETGISFLTLDDRTVQLQLAEGTIEVHLRNQSPDDAFEIDTPNLAFTITQSGEYRIQTDPDGSSTIIVVREGAGQVTGGGGDSWDLRPGQQYTFNGTDQISYDAVGAPPYDDFEDWCESRDQRENRAISARYVSRDVDGYYDLDEYGDWRPDPDYGEVWIPRGVPAGWAPYQYGHWVYVDPWGWTWVDEEPWGFAPFHYGRWALVGGGWAWVPGPIVVRPVYAPALVAFVGGGGFSLGVSFGGGVSGVAWFPLGPRDVYVPGYRCSPRYVENINVTNTRVIRVTEVTRVYNTVYVQRDTRIVNSYTYARNRVAVTAVSRDTFVNARPVSRGIVRVTPDQIQRARVVDSTPVAPVRASYVSANARTSNARPDRSFEQRPVIVRLTPRASRPTPVYTNQGRPGNQGQFNRGADNNNRGQFNGRPNNPPAVNDNQDRPGNRGQFNGAQPTTPPNNPPVSTERGNNGERQSRGGYRPFQPPANNSQQPNRDANVQPNNQEQRQIQQQPQSEARPQRPQLQQQHQEQVQQQQQEQRQYRYTPPQKAREGMYDVHPPLNQRQEQTARPQQQAQPPRQQEQSRPQQEPRPQAQSKEEERHQNNRQDNKQDKDKQH
ncbi:MAG TPA: DUF6600 domain-containing protein, partial [Candidatus Acidoferrales bacterium]